MLDTVLNQVVSAKEPFNSYETVKEAVETIDGFLVPGQEEFLFNKVKSLPEDALIVEVGSYQGRSTAAMAFACVGSNRKIYCIDPWIGQCPDLPEKSVFEVWKENLENYQLTPYIKSFQGYSSEIMKRWGELTGEKTIDFVFIDGSHEYLDVLTDFGLLLPLMKVGGWMAFHDVVETWPGCDYLWHDIVKFRLTDHEYSTTLACGRVKTTQELSEELQELNELRTLLVQSQQLQESGSIELEQSQTKLKQTQEQLQDTQDQLQQTQGQLQNAQVELVQTKLKQTQEQLQDTQKQLQNAKGKVELVQTQFKQTQEQLQQTQEQLQQTQEQLQNTQVELVQSQQLQESKSIELQQTQYELHHSKLEVAAMKTSKFWKLRSLWFKFKGLVGLPIDNQ
ncbi:MAG: class I SAM-dependent methyltransferase [Moorea sp. SIO1G6]|uniref:class I SAM-dependent methyltransferase n=1 Tax=Moorena sp. SIO1G6 TaxID=2607840 RepID=UPI0013BFB95D|nr:class I SAM-dependent methyltransferase [Moorena sp. SIO1G6]NET67212.1 class I SAM-dependent methyltransferase [Moorena sp. SIO1G6]